MDASRRLRRASAHPKRNGLRRSERFGGALRRSDGFRARRSRFLNRRWTRNLQSLFSNGNEVAHDFSRRRSALFTDEPCRGRSRPAAADAASCRERFPRRQGQRKTVRSLWCGETFCQFDRRLSVCSRLSLANFRCQALSGTVFSLCMRVAIVGKGRRERIQGRKQAKAQKSPMFYTNTS